MNRLASIFHLLSSSAILQLNINLSLQKRKERQVNGNDLISFIDPSSEVLLLTAAVVPDAFAGCSPNMLRPWHLAAFSTAKGGEDKDRT